MIGIILFGALGILLAIGVPIAMSLGIAATVALISSPTISVSIGVLAQRIFAGLESTSIMAIAFFVLAGNLMTKGGISRRIVEFANSIVGNIRGGMSLVLILACAFFAALSGSAPATVIAIGVILYEDMVRVGYKPERVAGLLVVSGGLGPVIPPSIIMVVYCTITGASVGDMFKSGMLIGICIVISLVIVVLYLANKEQWPKAEKKISFEELSKSFFSAIPALLLPIIILGGIYSGMLTPTESAAVAVVWSLIAGIFIYKEVKIKDIVPIVLDSAKGSAMILFIIAYFYSFFMALYFFWNF